VQKVIAKAGLSLMVVRPKVPSASVVPSVRYGHILVLLDGSYRADWALFMAARIAQANQAELFLLEVVQEPQVTRRVFADPQGRQLVEQLKEISKLDAQRHLQELRAQLPRSLEVHSRVVLAADIPPVVEEVVQADNVDLLVLGAKSTSDSSYWLYGPVTETVLAHASCPVLVFQDNLQHNIMFKPISGEPARSQMVEAERRVEAS
jgi:nucleotide-binding universal stress UspA family protein